MTTSKSTFFTLAVLAVSLLLPQPGSAIIIRHDREQAAYLELGARFPAVCQLGDRMGDGTLIDSHWVLTAAHVADGMQRYDRTAVRCEGVEYTAVEIHIHPEFRPMGPKDFALLRLDRPVEGIAPHGLYEGTDEIGRTAIMVGHGTSGTGDNRDRFEDGDRRGATNVIESANANHIRFHFDAPPGGTELEGIPGPGDSGGPALLEVDGEYQVAGVSSLGSPGDNGPGTYGADDFFGRVSTHLSWIRHVMGQSP